MEHIYHLFRLISGWILCFFLRSPFLFSFGVFTRASRHCIFHFQIWYAGVLCVCVCLRFSKYNAYKMMYMRINAVRKTCATLVVSGVLHSVGLGTQYFSSALYLSFPARPSPHPTLCARIAASVFFFHFAESFSRFCNVLLCSFAFISFCWSCCCCYCFWINALFPLFSHLIPIYFIHMLLVHCCLLLIFASYSNTRTD